MHINLIALRRRFIVQYAVALPDCQGPRERRSWHWPAVIAHRCTLSYFMRSSQIRWEISHDISKTKCRKRFIGGIADSFWWHRFSKQQAAACQHLKETGDWAETASSPAESSSIGLCISAFPSSILGFEQLLPLWMCVRFRKALSLIQ